MGTSLAIFGALALVIAVVTFLALIVFTATFAALIGGLEILRVCARAITRRP